MATSYNKKDASNYEKELLPFDEEYTRNYVKELLTFNKKDAGNYVKELMPFKEKDKSRDLKLNDDLFDGSKNPSSKINRFNKGGKVSSASSRADGCAQRGKTRGKMI